MFALDSAARISALTQWCSDRDHDINYMIAVPLIYGRLGTEDYTDEVASDPRIDDLRAKIQAEEE